jgi:ketosteroid isomerase-like protein
MMGKINFAPFERISTHLSPAITFGPNGYCVEGADRVNAVNERGASMFRPGSENRFDIMHKAACADLAYWVGVQRSVLQMHGKDHPVSMSLRVTEIFRREGDEWTLIHRHADPLAVDTAA